MFVPRANVTAINMHGCVTDVTFCCSFIYKPFFSCCSHRDGVISEKQYSVCALASPVSASHDMFLLRSRKTCLIREFRVYRFQLNCAHVVDGYTLKLRHFNMHVVLRQQIRIRISTNIIAHCGTSRYETLSSLAIRCFCITWKQHVALYSPVAVLLRRA